MAAELSNSLYALTINANVDHLGRTALHIAAENNHTTHVEFLLSHGANVDVRNHKNWTPLHFALYHNSKNSHLRTIKILLKNGANVNAKAQGGNTPLHISCRCIDVEIMQLLLNYKANVNLDDDNEQSPLLHAIANGTVKHVQLLVDHGSMVYATVNDRMTPLHHASHAGNLEIIKCLLRNGAHVDINTVNSSKLTPFLTRLSSYKDSQETLVYLLKYSDVNDINYEGKGVFCFPQGRVFWKTIVAHIAKLEALNIFINLDLIRKISNFLEYREYFKRCTDELAMAKSIKLHNSWITFFDLLIGSTKKLKNYAGNQDLFRDFQKSDCNNKFPIYGMTIWKNMNKAIKIRSEFDRSVILLSSQLPIFNPDHLVIRDILDCLKSKDYVKLFD